MLNWLPGRPASIATMAQRQLLCWANVGTPTLGQHGFVNCANVEPTLAQLCILTLGQRCANDCMPPLCQHWPNGQIHVGPTLVYQCWPNVSQCANTGRMSVLIQNQYPALNRCNKMNPGYLSLVATALKPQQIPMFLHISARVWGRWWSPHTSEQKGSTLKPQ